MCYEIMSHYLHFPNVADTYKSIEEGIRYWKSYPQNDIDFQCKRQEIIHYILTIRGDNFIYQCQESSKLFLPITSGFPSKTLFDDNRIELRVQLENEILVLILKGVHQVIKQRYPALNDNMLSRELLQQDVETLQKYRFAGKGQQ